MLSLNAVKKFFTRRPTTDQPTNAITRGYRPFPQNWFQQPRDLPPFNFATIYAMLLDPQVRLCLAMRAAPLHELEFAYKSGIDANGKPQWTPGIQCRNPAVAAWVDRQLKTIWINYIHAIAKSQVWGWSGGEVTLRLTEHRLIEVDRLLPRHASDIILLKRDGEKAGVRIKRVKNCGEVDLNLPYCWFHSHNPDAGEDYGVPILLGAYSPWADKWLNGAALDTRRLYMHKDAYGGMKIGYPEETMYVEGYNEPVSARDIATQIAEQRAAGGTVTYPTTRDAQGNQKWIIEEATVGSNPSHILQYPKDLDDEIRVGMEIPDDVISSDGTGAWAGKRVTMAAFYTGLDTWAKQIVADLRSTLDPLVLLNWGKAIDYDINFKPLGEQAMEQQGGVNQVQQNPIQQPTHIPTSDPSRVARMMGTAPAMDSNQAETIAEILTYLFGEEAESKFDEIFGSGVKTMATKWNALEHPRGKDGRFIAKNSPEAVSATKDKIKEALAGERTSKSLKSVTEHLALLTTAQLRDIQRENGIKAGGAKRSLVDKIAARLHGSESESSSNENGTPRKPSSKEVYTVPVSSLKTDPKRFQYKVKGVDESGVTSELKGVGKWNPELAGALLVWRDPESGQDYVVNGHHRHELASRLKADSLNVRYINAESAKEARARGALANIAEGRGSAVDAAKYLRDSGNSIEHLKDAGISMSGRVAADASILKDLADKPFQMVTEGRLDEDKAIAVAKHLKDHDLQNKLFKKLDDRESSDQREWTNREIETAAKRMSSAGSVTQSGMDLFGAFEDEQSTFDQEVEIESHISRMLQQEANDYRAVANKRRAERVTEAGNVLAVDENAKRAERAEIAVSTFEKETRLKSKVNEAIQYFAKDLATANSKKRREETKDQAAASVRAILGTSKEGDRDIRTGLLFKNGSWTRDAETSAIIKRETLKSAERDYSVHRSKYLQKYATYRDGKLQSVVLNTDDWRDHFPHYTGTNAHEVHEASSMLNKRLYREMLSEMQGKGNNTILILGGGGGSGKGTATQQFFNSSEYPIVLDQASAEYESLEGKLKDAEKNNFQVAPVFIDRGVESAAMGVIGRALRSREKGQLARTVPLEIARKANIDARKAQLELLEKRLDIPVNVVDNTSDERGEKRKITDRTEAISYLKNRIAEEDSLLSEATERTNQFVREKVAESDIAEGLLMKGH